MNFEEWYEQDETIIPHDIEHYDLQTVWNAAIDEAVKVAKDNLLGLGYGGDDEYNAACIDIAEKLEGLK